MSDIGYALFIIIWLIVVGILFHIADDLFKR